MIDLRQDREDLVTGRVEAKIEGRPDFAPGFGAHTVTCFIVEPGQSDAQLQQHFILRGKRLSEIEDLEAGVFDATDAQITEHEDQKEQQGKAGH
jgi:hypothetical protein